MDEKQSDIPIKLPAGTEVTGFRPLILIGPNGVGKTRLGTAMANSGYDRIPALRSLSFAASIPYQKGQDATREVDNQIRNSQSKPWEMAGELSHVLSELKAEDSQSAVDFRDRAETGATGDPEVTRLKKLVRLWRMIFPGRVLDLSTYDPKVRWEHEKRASNDYSANRMSDGERGALYLIARVLRAKPGVVIVDEPEVHFHALLARSFWDAIEAERSDCRFVYITHDLPFALSRSGARIGIVKAENSVELVPEDAKIPADLYEGILGAASLSIVAKRIVFCEGDHTSSTDIHFYSAWFHSPNTVVVPVGNCSQVQQAVEVFRANPVIANSTAIGIVERDYWPERHLAKLQQGGLHVLPANEVEGLLCIRGVAAAVAAHQAVDDFDAKYAAFEDAIRKRFVGTTLNKQVLERAKCDLDLMLTGIGNNAYPEDDAANTRTRFVDVVTKSTTLGDLGAIYDEHARVVADSLAKGAGRFLEVVPGKECLSLLCGKFGVTKPRYIELVCAALNQPDDGGKPELEALRLALAAALSPQLPARTHL